MSYWVVGSYKASVVGGRLVCGDVLSIKKTADQWGSDIGNKD
jgi:hypothetical protein